MYISVPDVEVLFKIYLDNLPTYNKSEINAVDLACGIIYGGQTNKYDFHYFGYSYVTLKSMLEDVGFMNIEVFNREEIKFACFNDAARVAKVNSIPISLNIKASK